MDEQHPFKPGARVAVQQGGRFQPTEYRQGFVDKVYKTGRFTLAGDERRQQWSPYRTNPFDGDRRWEARLSGYRGAMLLWDEETNAEITKANDEAQMTRRISHVVSEAARIRGDRVTPEVLMHLEAAVAAYKASASV